MPNQPKLQFPKRFLWGASTSAHQVEGGTHNQWSVWELEHAKSLAAQAEYQYGDVETWNEVREQAKDPGNYVSGQAADHYNLYARDFDILRHMNMNAFRFSIEWSRIEPTEGAWSAAAINHYKQYIAGLRERDIEPVVTLFHFTLPVWFADKGGFAKRANIKYFIRFVEKVMEEFGAHLKYIVTINEPEIYAHESYISAAWPPMISNKRQFLTVINNLVVAHKRAAKVIHDARPRCKVSIAKNSVHVYPGDDAWLTLKSAQLMQYVHDDYILKRVAKSCDFLAVNYYFSDRVYGYRRHNPNDHVSDLGWNLAPGDIQHVLERLHEQYNLPIIITENGVADGADRHRKWWLTHTIIAMQKAMKNGVQLEGYLHWSLLDNFEWDKGRWPRFGLIAVDYATQKRTPRSSAIWLGRFLRQLRGES